MAPQPIYNRDLVADLLKLAHTVIAESNYDSKVGKRIYFEIKNKILQNV
jgi:hypothetical protein